MTLDTSKKTVAVNNPGGQPRQYCVQFREPQKQVWRRSAVFRNLESANECLASLKKRGLQARLIHYRLPTAA